MTATVGSAAGGGRAAIGILLLGIVSLSAAAADRRVVRLPVAEGKDIRFAHLSTEEGLSQSRVDHLLQDGQGFLWIGTYNGLNRYDGYRFQQYKPEANNPNSLGGVFIYAMLQDRSGALWIAVDQGLDRFDPVTGKFLHFRSNPADPASLAGHVEHIAQDRDGFLWLSTRNGLDRLDPGSGTFKHYRNDPRDHETLASSDVRYVLEDRQGTLWIASAAGLDAFDARRGRVIRHYPSSQEPPFDRILEDHSGTLWLGATREGGLTSLDRQTGIYTTYTFFDDWPASPGTRGCSAILEDQHGMLWLATKPDGLVRFDRARRLFTRYRNDPGNSATLSSNDALSLIEDREGGIWVGTDGGGVNRFSSEPSPFTIYRSEPGSPNSLDQDYILSAFEDSHGVLWIGTKRLNALDRKTGRYTFYRHDPANPRSLAADTVLGTVEDRAGFLWFGTWGGGLNRFDRRTGTFKAYRHDPKNPASLSQDYIRSLLLDRQGNVWVGTEDGLNRLDRATGRFTVYRFEGPLETRIYRVLAESPDGAMWMGTYERGLQRLDVRTGRIDLFQSDSKRRGSLSNNRVNALCVDRTGTLWVGTQNGLNRLDRNTGEFTIFDERDGLPNNAIEGILEDAAGYLWVSTGNGLSKFDPRSRTAKNYFTEDGLSSNEFNDFSVYFKSSTGEMFFGGLKGVAAFFPHLVTENPFVPPVVLTDFRLFGAPIQISRDSPLQKSISFTSALTLSYRQNNFSLEFASLSYANPVRNRYRYNLEGLNEQWTNLDSGHRLVTFPFLPPGDYTLRVQGSSNRSVWNERGVLLKIRILPPFWGTWWFKITASIVLLAGAWLAYLSRVRSIQKRNRELVKLNLEMQQSQRALQNSEEAQRRLNRELRALSNCNEALIRADDEQLLLDEVCRIVCDDAGYRMAWVGYVEFDASKAIRPVAWAGAEDGYLAGTALTWAETERGSGPAGIAARRGETSYTQDLSTSTAFAPWREEALTRGYRSIIAFPLKDESGAVFGVLAIYSAEASAFTPEEIRLLEELAGDLAFGITVLRGRIKRDRTEAERKKVEEQLRQAQKMEVIGKLSGGIAHDFNNILGVINGYSETLLARLALDPDCRHDVQEILHAGNQAALLTRQLLAFSRKQVIQPGPVNLNQVVARLGTMLKRLMGEDIEITTVLHPDLQSVKADPGQMEQVILNLCVNARDAMPGGGLMTIETSSFESAGAQPGERFPIPAGRYVCLTVTDTGTGIDEATQTRMFEPFFTTKGPEKGTGLGLSTIHDIVKASGGEIRVRSQPGQGTAFCVYLPVTSEAAVDERPEVVTQSARRGMETILLVEDASSLRAMLRTCLEAAGYTVLEAEDGEHAIRISRSESRKIDLLLTDVSLPKVKGPSLAKILMQQRPGMRVLFISGYADFAIHSILGSRATILQKPFSQEELIRKLRDTLDMAESAAAPPQV